MDYQSAKKLLDELPKILGGQPTGKYTYILNVYRAHFLHEMFRLMHYSFIVRSERVPDQFGNEWQPLRPRTIAKKKKSHKRGMLRLPPSPTPESINRDTGRLVESYEPGMLVGAAYVPVNMDQKATWVGKKLDVGTRVPYAKEVSKLREIFPRETQLKIIRLAIIAGVKAIKPIIEKL